jgi:DNA-nicking Smr family endonuclease
MNVLDLHGYTLQDAHAETMSFLRDMHRDKEEKVKVITGKGAIAKEFPFWIEKSSYIKKFEPTNDGGCWHIIMADQYRPVM